MFTTFDSAEVQIPPIFEFPDQRWWGYVSLYRWSAYFHLVVQYQDEQGEDVTRAILYSGVDQVAGTCDDPDVQLIELQLILPPGLTGKEVWTMEPLSEILVGFEPGSECRQVAAVYVLANGERLVDSPKDSREEDLTDLAAVVQVGSKLGEKDPRR